MSWVCRRRDGVLGECAGRVGVEVLVPQGAEDLVTGLEVGHVLADGFHDTGDIGSPHRCRWPAEPDRRPHDVGDAGHGHPVGSVDAGGPHTNENVVGTDRRSPLSWEIYERHGPFPFTGALGAVRYQPGELPPDAPVNMIEVLRQIGMKFE